MDRLEKLCRLGLSANGAALALYASLYAEVFGTALNLAKGPIYPFAGGLVAAGFALIVALASEGHLEDLRDRVERKEKDLEADQQRARTFANRLADIRSRQNDIEKERLTLDEHHVIERNRLSDQLDSLEEELETLGSDLDRWTIANERIENSGLPDAWAVGAAFVSFALFLGGIIWVAVAL